MRRTVLCSSGIAAASAAALVGQLFSRPQPAAAPQASDQSPTVSASPIGATGADIITAGLGGVMNWGGLNGIAAYSLSGVRCNMGDVVLAEQPSTALHHVSGQQMYRVGMVDACSRIEQIGMSWCFHGFCTLQQTACGVCQPVGGGCVPALGIGCSDAYTSARCGTQNNNGPRYDINAGSGSFTLIPPTAPISTLPGNLLGKRLQVHNADLDPALHPGSQYFQECVTVHPQDGAAGNTANNAAHRRLVIGALTGTAPNQSYLLSSSGPSFPELPAIHAWRAFDPTVTIVNVDVPGDGRFVLAYDVTDRGDGLWHYEYAVYNISSHRSGNSAAA
jgi:hypothetical protein